MSKLDFLFHRPAAQVEVAILVPQILVRFDVVGDGERKDLGFVEHHQPAHPHFNRSGRHVASLHVVGPGAYLALDGDDIFHAQLRSRFGQLLVVRVDDQLRHTIAVAHVDEFQPAQVAKLSNPPHQVHSLAVLMFAQLAASVRPTERQPVPLYAHTYVPF